MLSLVLPNASQCRAVIFCAALLSANALPTLAAPQVTTVSGESENVRVPSVSEAWSATVGRVPDSHAPMRWHIGHFPGYREAKRQANARRQALESGRSRTSSNTTGPLSIEAQQAATPESFATASTSSGVVFDGPSESDTNEFPPDSQIAAGPNHVVVAVNSLLAIYDKTGVLQGSFQNFSSFFGSLGITGSIFDPRIIYDQTDQRFILSAGEIDFTNLTNGHVLLAVSASSDPTGVWNKFAIDSKGRNAANTANTFPDFPSLGLSQSAVYITTNQFALTQGCVSTDSQGCYFSDAWIRVIGLPGLLAGNPNLNITAFTNVQTAGGFRAFGIQPALTYGISSQEFLIAAEFSANPGTTLNLFAITTSGIPTLSMANLTVPQFNFPPTAIQPGASNGIITDDYRPLNVVWANGSLWCGQNVGDNSTGAAAVRWYEILIADLSSASLSQSGTVKGSGDAFYPALSVKADGTVAMAFTTSSNFQPASAAFTAREPSDAAGTMRGFAIYRAGLGAYDESIGSRWGDYSGISEDPDGNSLWMITEYAGRPDPHFGTAAAQITAPPSLSITPSFLNFGGVLTGSTSTPQTVTVMNISGSSVAVGTAAFSGANAADFAINSDPCSGTSLAANQTCAISITFKPSVNNWEDALLSIPYGPGNIVSVGMQGFGLVQAVLSFTPASLSFPPTVLQSASPPQMVTFMNSGNASAQLPRPSIGGDFTQTNNCPATLNAGASCQFTVTFHPISSGSLRGSLSAGFSQTPPVVLLGIGIIAPAVLFCPSLLSFPNQTINTASGAQPVILTNNGSASLNVAKITTAGDFSETDDCFGSLPARSACVINVRFKPSASGSRAGTLTVADDAQGSPQILALTGTGMASANNIFVVPGEFASVIQRSSAVSAGTPSAQVKLPGKQASSKRALYFEPNVGQFSPDIDFVAHVEGSHLEFSKSRLKLQFAVPSSENGARHTDQRTSYNPTSVAALSTHPEPENPISVNMALLGASPAARASGQDELAARSNYFIGNDPSRWRTNVATYGKVKLRGVYPGIDLIYYGNQDRLEYDFVVAPHANPSAIRLQFEGENRLLIDPTSGDLVVATRAGDVRFHKPLVYQTRLGDDQLPSAIINRQSPIVIPQSVEGHYALLAANEVGFQIGAYDRTEPLIIDPVMTFSTYLAGSLEDSGNAIAVDAAGNAYVAGSTISPDFPITSGAFKSTCGTSTRPCVVFYSPPDAFVTKLSPDGSLIYSTYLGGGDDDQAFAITVDSSGDAFVTGHTLSSDFPVTSGAFQATCPALGGANSFCSGAFVAKLNPAGSALLYSTYLGGAPPFGGPSSEGRGIAVDASGNALVGGWTISLNFPTTPEAFQTTATPLPSGPVSDSFGTTGHGFLSKLNPSGSSLVYSTYLGGSSYDSVFAVAVDSSGNDYAAGPTDSIDFPTTSGAYQTGPYGGDSFIAKFSPSGSVVYSTYFGGPRPQAWFGILAHAIAVDSTGAVYVAGSASQNALPVTPGAYQTVAGPYGSGSFGFISKIHPSGCAILYSTYIGSGNTFSSVILESASAVAVDNSDDAFIVGGGIGTSGQVNGLQPPLPNSSPVLIDELNPTGSALLFSSFLGGSATNTGAGIGLDSTGDIYVAGSTTSPDFPMANPFQTTCPGCEFNKPGGKGVFVTKISPRPANAVLLTRNSLTFAPKPLGSSNLEVQAVGLMNQLSVPLNISSVNVSGASFAFSNYPNSNPVPCTGAIAPGTGCFAELWFNPSATGPQTGTLTISDDGPGSPRTISLNGIGTADFMLALASGTNPTEVVKGSPITYAFNIQSAPGVIAPAGDAAMSCAGISPAVCTFSPTSISILGGNNQTNLTVSNLSAVTGNSLNFSVVGTLGSQTYSLPLSIIFQDFSLGAASGTSTSATVTAGQTATYPLSFSGTQGFTGTVSVACSGAPTLASCTIAPASLSLYGTNPVNATVAVTTASRSFPLPSRRAPPTRWLPRLPLGFAALVIFLALAVAFARRRNAWVVLATLLMIVALWANCGSGGAPVGPPVQSGTPAGTYTLTITGTYGSGSTALTHTLNLTLTVN